MQESLLCVKNLTFKYESSKSPLYSNLSFILKKSESMTICGKSGSGKTTLAYILMGLHPTYIKGELSWEIFIEGKDARDLYTSRRTNVIGLLFQEPSISFFTSSVEEELCFSAQQLGLEKELILARREEVIKEFQLNNIRTQNPFGLSYGEQRLVALASIATTNPRIIILDEPFMSMDVKNKEFIKNFLKRELNNGKAILIFENKGYRNFESMKFLYLENYK